MGQKCVHTIRLPMGELLDVPYSSEMAQINGSRDIRKFLHIWAFRGSQCKMCSYHGRVVIWQWQWQCIFNIAPKLVISFQGAVHTYIILILRSNYKQLCLHAYVFGHIILIYDDTNMNKYIIIVYNRVLLY